jgi:hypothetical protein
METVEKVLQLYREQYHDLNVKHFHEKSEIPHLVSEPRESGTKRKRKEVK